jgi:hypothetical protein
MSDFSGEVDTTQYTLSSYGALELSDKGSIEAVLGVAKATHKISKSLPVAVRSMAKPIILSWAMRLSIPILRDLRLNSVH